mmetsp:Transcript_18117/g.30263  ORF Transcript_18117/g.30263 Transcript_18117/m.30263 type:complete len:298 (+) Transcript_18117:91-984(+)
MIDSCCIAQLITHPDFEPKEPLRGGPTLTQAALAPRLLALANQDPAIFLERYGQLLSSEELASFDCKANEYCVAWHLKELRRSAAQKATQIRNRRFRAMQKLEGIGDYFSDHQMHERAPEVYQSLLGRFCEQERKMAMDSDTIIKEKEVTDSIEEEHDTESSDDDGCGKEDQETDSGDQESEADDADDEGEETYEAQAAAFLERERREQMKDEKRLATWHADGHNKSPCRSRLARQLPAAEVQHQREVLLQTMRERFIDGLDSDWFDYRQVDNNAEYDDLEKESRDAEERWFDADSD